MTFSETAPGKLVNLLSNDVNRFEVLSVYSYRLLIVVCLQNKHIFIAFFLSSSSYTVNSLWTSPLSAVIATYFLWQEAGLSGIVGVMIILIVAPLQSKYTFMQTLLMNPFLLLSEAHFGLSPAAIIPSYALKFDQKF